jgi:hypothetical protein
MAVSVSEQTAYLTVTPQGLWVTEQTAYVAMLLPTIQVASQTAYIAMLSAGAQSRRRQLING